MLLAFVFILLAVLFSILVHYEFLYQLTKTKITHHFSLVFVVFVILIAHIFEVLIFALAFYLFEIYGLGGLSLIENISQTTNSSFFDLVYFSFSTFSTLGYGDLNPVGYFRILASIESLLGFILITWSASFLFYEMQKYWDKK